jgi:hypothetical protein
MRIHFYFLFVVLFMLSCDNNHPDNYAIKPFTFEDAPFSRKLFGYKENINGLLYPRRILNLDNYLVVSENKADTLLYIIDKEKMQVVNKTGIQGRGPGEIGFAWVLYNGEKADEFWVHSLADKSIHRFDATLNDPLAIEDVYLTKGEMFYGIGFAFSSDSTYMQILVDDNSKFVEYDNNGDRINSYDTWDHMVDQKLPYNIISSLYQGMLNVSPDKQHYALSCIKTDVIEILDKESGVVTSVRGPLHHLPDFKVDNSPGYPMLAVDRRSSIQKYINTVLTDDNIYALFSGASSDQIKTGEKYCNDIFIFDYEGNVKGHYVLDITISYLAVDEENRKFYGLSYDDDPNVVVFDF